MKLGHSERVADTSGVDMSSLIRRPPPATSGLLAESDGSISACVSALQEWLSTLSQRGHAVAIGSGERIIRIDQAASSRFCLGLHNGFAFIGVAATELFWFRGLPWFHLAIKRGSPRLNLLCEHVSQDDFRLAPFCLSLTASNLALLAGLYERKLIDVREIHVSSSGSVTGVSNSVVRTIDIRIVTDDSTIEALKGGRLMTGHTHRSVVRSVK